MVAYVQQSIGLGAAPNDDNGDDLRVGGDKLNDNFDEIFGAQTFEAGGANAVTYDASGNSSFSGTALTLVNASNPKLTIRDTALGVAAMNRTLGTIDADGASTTGAIRVFARILTASNDATDGVEDGQIRLSVMDTGTLTDQLTIDKDATAFAGDVDPAVTEIQDMGSLLKEWDNLFLQNAPTVSDKRKKNDLGSASSLVPMMKLLDPRVFSRKSKVVKAKKPTETLQRQKMEIVQKKQIQIIDDVPTVMTVDVEQPVVKMVTLKDEGGNFVKRKGKVVKYPVPVMENYTIPAEDEIVVSHGRPHTGFMAQDVKQAMTDAKVDDWAGYAYHNDEGEDTHVLRLQEFIAPMLAYIQELEGRIKKLEGV